MIDQLAQVIADACIEEHNRAVLQALHNDRFERSADPETGALWESCFKATITKTVNDYLKQNQLSLISLKETFK